MKKISTVLIAMLLLTLSVLAAHADQEGNARWCNIDNDGCYLNEEGGVKSYMYFWTVESCKFFMGNDDPCKNVVPRYYSADGRHPLEPAPEPIVYQPKKPVKPEEPTIPGIAKLYEMAFPKGVYVMKGGLVITDSIQGNGEFTDLQAASASALLIPVYKMLDFSKVEGVTLTDYLQMEVFGGQGNTGAVITNMDNKQQAAILIEDMDRGPEEVKLIGYVPAEAVGVNTGKELNLSAGKLNVISENEEGTELQLGLPVNNSGNTGYGSEIHVEPGGNAVSREPGSDIGFLKEGTGGTAAWYRIDNQEGSVPGGVILNVNWTADNPTDVTGGAIYFDNSGKVISCTFVDNNGNPINGSASASGTGNVNDGKLSGGELTPEDKHLSGDLSGYGQISGENFTAGQIISKIKFISGKKKLMITGADGISIQLDITAKLKNNSETRFDTNLDKDPAISERYQRIDSHIIELGVGYRF